MIGRRINRLLADRECVDVLLRMSPEEAILVSAANSQMTPMRTGYYIRSIQRERCFPDSERERIERLRRKRDRRETQTAETPESK